MSVEGGDDGVSSHVANSPKSIINVLGTEVFSGGCAQDGEGVWVGGWSRRSHGSRLSRPTHFGSSQLWAPSTLRFNTTLLGFSAQQWLAPVREPPRRSLDSAGWHPGPRNGLGEQPEQCHEGTESGEAEADDSAQGGKLRILGINLGVLGVDPGVLSVDLG